MDEKGRTGSSAPPLSPRLQRLLALDHHFFGRPRTNAEELKSLYRLLAEGHSAAQRVNLERAMFIAADNSPSAETAALIGRILNDRSAPEALRRQAAAFLGDIPERASSKALTEALIDAPASLEFAVLTALAKVGDDEAAAAIAKRRQGSQRLQRLRAVARALIARRSGTADEAAEAALLPEAQELPLKSLGRTEIADAVSNLRGSTYGIKINPALACGWTCEGERALLLLSDELAPGRIVAALTGARRIAGVIATPDQRGSKTLLARRVVATRPERDGSVSVSVLGADGEIESSGTLRSQGKGLQLILHSHAGAARMFEVQGYIDDDKLALHARVLASLHARKLAGDVDPATV